MCLWLFRSTRNTSRSIRMTLVVRMSPQMVLLTPATLGGGLSLQLRIQRLGVRLKASSRGRRAAHSSQPAPLPPAQRPSSLRHAIIENRLHPVWRAGPCLCLYALLVFEIRKKIRWLLDRWAATTFYQLINAAQSPGAGK